LSLFQAIVLAIVQGVTEFLPVSSSGHLALVPWIAGWPDQGLAYDVATHMGTLGAVLVYFRREWAGLVLGILTRGRSVFGGSGDALIPAWRLLGLLILGTIPAAIVGPFLKDALEGPARKPEWIAAFLIGTAAVLAAGELAGRRRRGLATTSRADAVIIGLAQAAAVLPGLSRSGTTIAAAMLLGLTREAAARFSFLLAVPAIFGAGILILGGMVIGADTTDAVGPGWGYMALGAGISFATALAALWGLMKLLRTRSLWPFAGYCFLAGLAILIARGFGA
jgi:undecaprenyl-diphosphatase